jgi:hypothetical protein
VAEAAFDAFATAQGEQVPNAAATLRDHREALERRIQSLDGVAEPESCHANRSTACPTEPYTRLGDSSITSGLVVGAVPTIDNNPFVGPA